MHLDLTDRKINTLEVSNGELILHTEAGIEPTGIQWEDITGIDLYNNNLKTLPPLSYNLDVLDIGSNQIETLPSLVGVDRLYCSINRLVKLPELGNLTVLSCRANRLRKLPKLDSLISLVCDFNPFDDGVNPDNIPIDLQQFVPNSAFDRYETRKILKRGGKIYPPGTNNLGH